MIRQAHSYFLGAVSGTALIAAAVVAAMLLISAGALRDWPIAGFGDDGGSVSSGQPVGEETAGPVGPVGVAAVAGDGASGGGAGVAGKGDDVSRASGGPTAIADIRGESPSADLPTRQGATPGATSPADQPSGSGGATGSSPGSTGNGGDGGDGVKSPLPGGGSVGGGGSSTSGAVTDTVNETVAGADSALGGTLGKAGVTKATEEVVDSVAGPESTVGKTVDQVTKTVGDTVGGLLGGNR